MANQRKGRTPDDTLRSRDYIDADEIAEMNERQSGRSSGSDQQQSASGRQSRGSGRSSRQDRSSDQSSDRSSRRDRQQRGRNDQHRGGQS
ncbi:MAG TPA: hypothetical protein VFL93_15175 [Longimicrobiaceae bacterium]|nr:hypothetical protein [Longimicrobiaceae bacterium]